VVRNPLESLETISGKKKEKEREMRKTRSGVIAPLFSLLLLSGAGALLTSTPSRAETKTYTFCSNEWQRCNFTGTRVIRFGGEGKYAYLTRTGGADCRYDTLGADPLPGKTKACYLEDLTPGTTPPSPTPTASPTVKPSTTPSPSPTASAGPVGKTYTFCSNEWQRCNFTGTRVIRFGAEGKYTYLTRTDGVDCRYDLLLPDPLPGKTKACYLEDLTPGTPPPSPTPTASPTVKPSTTPSVTPSPAPTTAPGSAQRPSYNKGTGFFVLNGKLYDANGNEFRMRGVNKVHWDNWSLGLNNANSNTTRWTIDFRRDANQNVALLRGDTGSGGTIAQKQVVIPGNWDGTCKDDPSYLNNMVNTWVAQIPSFKALEKYMILNIANEWGPGNGSTVWRDSYISAIGRIRAAGWHGAILVTSGGCGQDANDLLLYAKDVFNSDPEKNIVFDQHVYGVFADSAGGAPASYGNQPEISTHFAKLAALGLPIVIGEFGPGRNIGPSPTNISPTRVMQLANQNGLGWLAWAWDDNNLNGGLSDDNSFSMSYSGSYNSSSDLTIYGKAVVEGAGGLKATGQPASIFR
jgi:YHS domain-containing protein